MAGKLDVPSYAAYAQGADRKNVRAAITVSVTTVDGQEGVTYPGFNVEASGAHPPFAYLMAEGNHLPPGLFLDVDTGAVAGTPTEAGSYSFRIRVFDDARRMVYTKPLTIVVTE